MVLAKIFFKIMISILLMQKCLKSWFVNVTPTKINIELAPLLFPDNFKYIKLLVLRYILKDMIFTSLSIFLE
jgi:hypothetical protein